MAAEPNAREIARRLTDEVLAARSLRRPVGVRTGGGDSGTQRDGRHGSVAVVSPSVGPEARNAAQRLVDEVLSAHGLRIGGRGVRPPVASGARTGESGANGSTNGRAAGGSMSRVDPQAAARARRIVEEVLREHGSSNGGPPPAPSRQEREARRAAARPERASEPSAVLISDARMDVDPATAARRIVEEVLGAHEAAMAPDAIDVVEPAPDDDTIPRELFPAEPAVDEPGAGARARVEVRDDDPVDGAVMVDVTDDTGPDSDGARTAARIVADLLAARAVTGLRGGNARSGPGEAADEGATQAVQVLDTRVVDLTDVRSDPGTDAGPVGDALPDGREEQDDWSAVVPVSSYVPGPEDMSELDPGGWPEPTQPRRTGRWLLTTVLGAVGLAYLFPLAVRAVRELVALS